MSKWGVFWCSIDENRVINAHFSSKQQ